MREAVDRIKQAKKPIIIAGVEIHRFGLQDQLEVKICIDATSEQLQISYHHYPNVPIVDFLDRLIQAKAKPAHREIPDVLRQKHPGNFQPQAGRSREISRMISRINDQIDVETIVIADIGDSLFASSEDSNT